MRNRFPLTHACNIKEEQRPSDWASSTTGKRGEPLHPKRNSVDDTYQGRS
jgi:hypothetical protein